MESGIYLVILAGLLGYVLVRIPGMIARKKGGANAAKISLLSWSAALPLVAAFFSWIWLPVFFTIWSVAMYWAISKDNLAARHPCPHCGEAVLVRASVCPFCHGQLIHRYAN